jgi:hypothetical protein
VRTSVPRRCSSRVAQNASHNDGKRTGRAWLSAAPYLPSVTLRAVPKAHTLTLMRCRNFDASHQQQTSLMYVARV